MDEQLIPNQPVSDLEEQARSDSDIVLVPETKRSFWGFAEKNFLGLSIMIGALLISGSLIYTNGGGLNINGGTAQIQQDAQGNVKVDVSSDDDPILGNKNAKVTIIEFSDFQ